jgi:hypothetical protein
MPEDFVLITPDNVKRDLGWKASWGTGSTNRFCSLVRDCKRPARATTAPGRFAFLSRRTREL